MQHLKQILLNAPESAFEPALKELVESWDEEPTALELLRLLDEAAYIGGANEAVMQILDRCLHDRLGIEGITMDDLIGEAAWRH